MWDTGLIVRVRSQSSDIGLAAEAPPFNEIEERVRAAGLELAGINPQILPPAALHWSEGLVIDVQGRLPGGFDREEKIRTVADDGCAFFHVLIGKLRDIDSLRWPEGTR